MFVKYFNIKKLAEVNKTSIRVTQLTCDRLLGHAAEFLGFTDEDILVNVRFVDSLPGYGYMNWIDDDEYEIVINKSHHTDDIIKTIFHEMVHVKQVYDGRFDPDSLTWHKKDYSSTEYMDLPWEIEAFDLEAQMFKKMFGPVLGE